MQHPVRRALTVALAAGGFALLGSTAALATENTDHGLVEDVVTDVVADVPVNAPVDDSCNNVAVLSDGTSTECTGDDTDTAASGDTSIGQPDVSTESDHGLVEKEVTNVVATTPVNAPVDVSCNNVGVLSDGGSTECTGQDTNTATSGDTSTGQADTSTESDHGLVENVVTNVVATTPVNAPVDVSCNNVTVLSDGTSTECSGNDTDTAVSGETAVGGGETTNGSDGGVVEDVVTDVVATTPINAPVDVSCDTVTVLSDGSTTECTGNDTDTAASGDTSTRQADTSTESDHGLVENVVTEAAVTAPVNAPVDVSCNNVTVLSDGTSTGCTGNDTDTAASGDVNTDDRDSADASTESEHGLVEDVVTDVVADAPVNAPVDVSCNNVTVLSDGTSTECTGNDKDTAASGDTSTGDATAEDDSGHGLVEDVVTDVVADAPVNAPVDVSCNNVTVLSDGTSTECTGRDSDTAASGAVSTGDEGANDGAGHGAAEDVVTDVVVIAPVNAPVDVSCNNVTVLGHGNSTECTGDDSDTAASGDITTSEPGTSQGSDGGLVEDVVTDGVVIAPVNAPVDASCNTVTVLAHGNSSECTGNDTDTATSGALSTGDDGSKTAGKPGEPVDSDEPATPWGPSDSEEPRDHGDVGTAGASDQGDSQAPAASGSAGAGPLMASTTGAVHVRAVPTTVELPARAGTPSVDRLAMTGSEQAPLALLALLLVGAGALLVRRPVVAVNG